MKQRTILFYTNKIFDLLESNTNKRFIYVYDEIEREYCIVNFSTKSKFFDLLYEKRSFCYSLRAENKLLIYNVTEEITPSNVYCGKLKKYLTDHAYNNPKVPNKYIINGIEMEHAELFL